MKNKILSVFLAVTLLLACFAPAILAADTSDNDYGAELYADTTFEAAATAYRNAVAALKTYVSNGSYTHTAASYAALQTADEAKFALFEAAAQDSAGYSAFLVETFEGTTYVAYHNARKSEFDSLSAKLISEYKECVDFLKTMDSTTTTYANVYNTVLKPSYDLLLTHEVAALEATYAFSAITVPGGSTSGGTTTSGVLKDIETATTLASLITAVNAAAEKINSLDMIDKMRVNEAQLVVNYLTSVASSTVLLSISETGLGASEEIYNRYLGFSDFQKNLCANITNVDNATFVSVCKIATQYYAMDNPSADSNIMSLYTAFNALSSPDRYCHTSFREALTAAYTSFTTECNMSVSVGDFNTATNQATVTVKLSAGYTVTSARVILDISGIWFTTAWLGEVNVANCTLMSVNNNSGVLEVDISNFVGYTATVDILLNVPADISEKEINISVHGTVNSAASSSDLYGYAKILCCSHRVAGALVYEQKTLKQPTCSQAGLVGYFCKLCGARLTASDGAPADIPLLSSKHTPGEKVIAGVTNIASNCTTAGIQYFECADCHAVITTGVRLPASHKVNINTVTWNATANTWNANCTGCSVVFDATATKSICTCEATYGKSFAKVIATKTATCGVRGYNVYQCQVCTVTWVESYGQVLENHTWGSWVTTTPATCTTEGVQTSTCSVCLQTKTQPVGMLNHDYQIQTYTPSTCLAQGEGYAVEKCSRCNNVNEYKLPLADHKYDGEAVVTTPATCAATGVKEFTCTVCNTAKKTEVIAIDPNNHVELVTETVTEATCIAEGLDITTCKSCDYRTETVTEASGHNWQTITNEEKLTEKKCLNCKAVWSQKETKKATILSITSGSYFTFSIANSDIAEKNVEFAVTESELPEEYITIFDDWFDKGDYDAKYYGAYAAELLIDGEKASATEDMSLVINLGEDFKKKEFFVVAINADNTFEKVEAERDGATIVVSGENYNDIADKTFVVMTSNEKAGSSPVVAIIICVAVVAIAGIAIVLVLTTKGGKKKGVRV